MLVRVGFAQAQTPITTGFRDFTYPSGVGSDSRVTSEKPESKLWWHDGSWWGCMWSRSAAAYHVHRLNLATQTWVDMGTELDDRINTKADALWDGTHLYVVSHVFNGTSQPATASNRGELFRLSYDPVAHNFTRDPGYPVQVTGGRHEALVVAKDTTGQLWVAYTESRKTMINHSVGGNDAVWGTPFVLPAPDTTNLTDDDLASVVAYDGHIGVMWSNQSTDEMYFAAHEDGTSDTAWDDVVAFGISADDHINFKAVSSDDAGRLFVMIKTSVSSHLITLLVCQDTPTHCTNPDDWEFYVVYGSSSNTPTRPILLLDTENREIYVFTANSTNNREGIYYKKTSMDAISFQSGIGTPFITSSVDNDINDATSTKQNLNSATDLVILASAQNSLAYFHNTLTLAASGSGCNSSAQCNDGLFCNGTETCVSGNCQAGTPVNCGDGVACTTDGCNESTDSCTHTPNNLACSDGFFCTGTETCTLSGCQAGVTVDCDDANACTTDSCDELGDVCQHVDTCAPPGGPVVAQEVKTGSSLGLSTVATAQSVAGVSGNLYLAAISYKPNKVVTGVAGLGLTWTRVGAQCAGRAQTGIEVWKAQGTPSGSGVVTATLQSSVTSAVIAVTRYSGVSTSNALGSIESANTNGVDGACAGGVDNSAYSYPLLAVGSGSMVYSTAAMRNRTHTPGAGYLEYVELISGAGGSSASSVAVSHKTTASAGGVTVDGTFDGSADWAAFAAEIRPGATALCSTNGDCSDGLFCDGVESCVTGSCQAGVPPALSDGVPCTVDACSETLDVIVHTPVDIACGDGLFCTGTETCNVSLGCQAGLLVNCDDANVCTTDTCNEAGDTCQHTDTCNPPAAITAEEVRTGSSIDLSSVATAEPLVAVADNLYLAAISYKPNKVVTGVTGLGLTWTRVGAQCAGRAQTGIEVWKAQGTPSGSGVVTATLQSSATGAVIAVTRYSGVSVTNAVGSIESANTNGVDGACAGGVDNSAYSYPLPAVGSGSVVYSTAAMRNRTHTPGAGYLEDVELMSSGGGSGASSVAVSHKTTASAAPVTVNGTFSGSIDWAALALAINP